MKASPVWKTNNQSQLSLLPPSYDDFVPDNHPVRIVNTIIDQIDISSIERTYKGGGTSSYHPRDLIKILIYAYLRNLYSSRKIEQALGENVHFMWLSGCIQPDHNTISNFRSGKLKGKFKDIFNQVVILLAEQGYLNIKDIYVDGTKIEANANRYTFVWGKSIKNSRERIKKQLNYAKNNWPKNVAKYNKQQAQMGHRNSMSKTDPDATFMRMKDDHMQNGQLKPGYNLQASSNNQFIVNYTLAQTTADTTTLINHLEEHQESFDQHPEILTADAGYGSEQNYTYLEDQNIEAFVKYSYFHKEQKQHKKPPNPFHPDQLHYNIEQDCYYCPMGQRMQNIGACKRTTKNGHLQTYIRYQASNCKGCSLRGSCFKAKGNRVIERNYQLIRLKAKAKLLSERGVAHRKQRSWDIEAIFGNIKHNMNFKRFMLRGIDKVNTEIGLIAMAHNLKKVTLAI